MSGIVGVINPDGQSISPSLLDQITDGLEYLGPDARSTWVKDNVGLGFALFNTNPELEHDQQPVTFDQSIYLVADARIDGRDVLLAELNACGRQAAKDCSDAELILHAYEIWSQDCVRHLIGDFSFVLWDGRQKTLFCARDHFGIKPLYYARVQGVVVFSNDLETLRRYPGVSSELNEQALIDYLVFSVNKDQSTTFYKDILRLPPGHVLHYDGVIKIREYWSPTYNNKHQIHYADMDEYARHFGQVFGQAVTDRTPPDRVEIQMSGGTDSTAIAAITARLRDQRYPECQINSLTVASGTLYPNDEEGELARLAAYELGIGNEQILLDNYGLYGDWENAYRLFSQPVDAPTPALNRDYGRQLRENARVSLTGVGGDPLMYGTGSYMRDLMESEGWLKGAGQILHQILSSGSLKGLGLRQVWANMLDKPAYSVPPIPDWLDHAQVERLGVRSRWKVLVKRNPDCLRHSMACHALLDPVWTHYFENYYGVRLQQTETRHPYFDVRLVDYVFSLPFDPRIAGKGVLREAMKGVLPERIRTRPKTVFQGSTFRDKIPSVDWVEEMKAFHEPILSPYLDTGRYFQRLREYVQTGVQPKGLVTMPLSLSYWLATRD